MLYTSDESLCSNVIDHRLVLDGLNIGKDAVFINLRIDTANRHATTHGSSEYKPSVETLGCFRGRSGTAKAVNVIERIGCKYFVFGVQLLNDEHGSFIEAIENELNRNSTKIVSRDVNYGFALRLLHANGGSMFFLCVYFHISRGIYYGSYTKKIV